MSSIRLATPPRPPSVLPAVQKRRPEALERLLDNGFDERVKRFREGGRGVSLTEVPKALDQLLDLRSTELRLLLGEMGLDYRDLLRKGKLPPGPTTAEHLIRALSGELTGTGDALPTTSAEARARALEQLAPWVGARKKGGVEGAELALLQRGASDLLEVAKKIDGLRRLPWHQKLGGYAQVGFHMRFFQAPAQVKKKGKLVDNPAAKQGGWVKLSEKHGLPGSDALKDLSGAGLSPGKAELLSKLTSAQLTTSFGAQVGEVDRQTGKRKVSPYFSEVFKTTFSAVGYMASRERRGRTVKVGFQLAQMGYDPIFGTNFRVTLPWKGALFISERYIGTGIFNKGALADGLPLPGVPYVRIPVSIAVGIGGDAVEHATGPFLRYLEDQVERIGALRTKLGRKKGAPADADILPSPPCHRSLGFDVRDMDDPAPVLPLSLNSADLRLEATRAKE